MKMDLTKHYHRGKKLFESKKFSSKLERATQRVLLVAYLHFKLDNSDNVNLNVNKLEKLPSAPPLLELG